MRMTPERSVGFQPEGEQPCLVSNEDLLRIASQVGAGDRRPLRGGRLPLLAGAAITTALLTACGPGSVPPPSEVVRENKENASDPVSEQEREKRKLVKGLETGQVVFAKEPEEDSEDQLRVPAPTEEETPLPPSTITSTPRPSPTPGSTPSRKTSLVPTGKLTAGATPTEMVYASATPTATDIPTDTPKPTETPTPVVTPGAEVIVEKLNVRGGPGTNYVVVDGLASGAKIEVVGRTEDGWLKVKWTDETGEHSEGWISGNPNYVAANEKTNEAPMLQSDEIPPTPAGEPTVTREPPTQETSGDLYKPDISKVQLPEIVNRIPSFPHEAGITVNMPGHFPDFLWGDRSVEGAYAGEGILEEVLGIDDEGGVHLVLDFDPGDAQQLKEVILPVRDLPLNFVVQRARQGEELLLSTQDPDVVYALLNRPNLFRAHAGEPLAFSILNGYQGRYEIRLIVTRASTQTW